LRSVFFTSENTGYVVGDNGIILKTNDGGGTTGINKKQLTNSLKIYPNPVREKISIELPGSGASMIGTVYIYGMTGQEMFRQEVKSSKVELSVSSLPSSAYFIRMISSKGTGIGKFVKE
jgi:photosystem II stability/assembly factor-like uncharacterized protein